MEFISAEAKYVLQFINQTNRSIFLTGKAGTGKTTLLKEIIQTTHKNCVVVAPTGIAALNAGGIPCFNCLLAVFYLIILQRSLTIIQNLKVEQPCVDISE